MYFCEIQLYRYNNEKNTTSYISLSPYNGYYGAKAAKMGR
jgi:hypothetical protein